MVTCRLGSRKRVSISLAWEIRALLLLGPPRARLIGRWERGSAEVGIDSGMGSDILEEWRDRCGCERPWGEERFLLPAVLDMAVLLMQWWL
jgi:hypothetical protein